MEVVIHFNTKIHLELNYDDAMKLFTKLTLEDQTSQLQPLVRKLGNALVEHDEILKALRQFGEEHGREWEICRTVITPINDEESTP